MAAFSQPVYNGILHLELELSGDVSLDTSQIVAASFLGRLHQEQSFQGLRPQRHTLLVECGCEAGTPQL